MTHNGPGPVPVDNLREKLKELGYLRTGVDRFVLAPARQERSAARIVAGASARVALLAGLLLGPAAAVGIAARLPALVTGVRDALVVAIYLAVLFGLAGGALTLTAALVAGAAVRLGGRSIGPRLVRVAPGLAGVVVTAACLAYLALWWSTTTAEPAWRTPVWTGIALAAALSISLVIGHAVAVTVGVVVARASATMPAPPAAGRRTRLPLVLRVGAFAAAAALLVATAQPGAMDEASVPPDFAVVPTGQRVVVIGIDGLDVAYLERLEADLRWLKPTGASARLLVPSEVDPARDWTTIATGVRPEIHGISELELRRVAGLEGAVARSQLAATIGTVTDLLRLTKPAIASGLERSEKTFWEVAAEKGLNTTVVNWWATWPAAGPGTVLSDRAVLRLEHGGPLDAEIAPASLYERLRADWLRLSHDADALVRDVFSGIEDERTRAAFLRSGRLDAIVAGLALETALDRTDLLALYLPGLDIVQHTFSQEPAAGPLAIAARAAGTTRYYAFLDRLIGRLAGEDVLLMVVTQPGRTSSAARGLVTVKGPNAAVEGSDEAALMAVAPTVLYALGIPVSRSIAGAPLVSLFDRRFVDRVPLRTIETYGRRAAQPPARGGQPLDKEMLERLRSLGYVR